MFVYTFLVFLFGIELQSSYIDRNRRIYGISTVTHTRSLAWEQWRVVDNSSLCTDTRVTA